MPRRVIGSLTLVAACILVASAAARPAGAPSRRTVWAFTAPWDPSSDASVRAHAARLDAVVTGWIALDTATAAPILPSQFPDRYRGSLRRTTRMAIVTNWLGDRFHAATIRALAADPARLTRAAGLVAQHARQMGYGGLVLDFEELKPADRDGLVRVVRAFTTAAHAAGTRVVTVAVPALDTDAYPLAPLLGAADLALLMLYDQHWSTGEPGPIAEPKWVGSALDRRLKEAPADRIVAGLPTYGYRWRRGAPTETLTWAQAKRIAGRAGVALTRDRGSRMLTARDPGGAWELWVSDAYLVRALEAVARERGVDRIAYWRLGDEDPQLW